MLSLVILLVPATPGEKSFDDIIAVLYVTILNLNALNVFIFTNDIKRWGRQHGVDAALRKLTVYCPFGATLEDTL